MLYVIMSVYQKDSLSFLRKSIQSIFSQSYSDFIFCILCDGVIKKEMYSYLKSLTDKRIRFIERKENKGLAVSMNELLTQILPSGAKYIARMDADDISQPDRFEKQVAFMEQHPEIDCLGTWAIEIDADENEYFKKQMPVTHDECLHFFKKRDCMIHPTVMFRRSYFEKAGLYPEDTYFGEDTMMWAKGFRAGCHFANLPEYLFHFRLDARFFERRRGWKHAKSIYQLRRKVNKMLDFGWKENIYAGLYAIVKLMPEKILSVLYKTLR